MRVEAIKTPATVEQIGRALALAWLRLFGAMPSHASIALLLAQSSLETGRWRSLYNFGLGNAKWTPATETDHCYRQCNELLPEKAAQEALAKSEPRTDGIGQNVTLGGTVGGFRIVWFFADHPASAFRAFDTLEAGAVDYLSLLATRFASAWPAVISGDPVSFVTRLRANRYFTAPLDSYMSSVVSLFREYSHLAIDLSTPPTDPTGALAAVQDASLASLSAGLIAGGFRDKG